MMKKTLVTIALFLGALSTHAQFSYANQWALVASGGIAQKGGYNIQLGADHAFGLSIHGIQLRANFGSIPIQFKEQTESMQRWTAHINYSVSLDQVIKSRWFFMVMTGGVVVGYDNVPGAIGNDIKINTGSSMVAGLGVSSQCEFKVLRQLHLFVEPKFAYLPLSAVYNYDFGANIGFKIYL